MSVPLAIGFRMSKISAKNHYEKYSFAMRSPSISVRLKNVFRKTKVSEKSPY
jgi:hypothetical protein